MIASQEIAVKQLLQNLSFKIHTRLGLEEYTTPSCQIAHSQNQVELMK